MHSKLLNIHYYLPKIPQFQMDLSDKCQISLKFQKIFLKIASTMTENLYLNDEISPFAVHEHVHRPIYFLHYFVPNSAKTELISGSETINFIKPDASEEIGYWNMFSNDHTAFRDICKQKQ